MMVARNRFSSQNESPKEPVRGTENILTSGENTYRKACIERKKATLQISILIPLLVGAARSLVERTRHQMAVLQIRREQAELADSDRARSFQSSRTAYYVYPWFRAEKEERGSAKTVMKF
jgi:hypothetical protein